MTNTPERKIEYKDRDQLDHLYEEHGFGRILADCQRRVIADGAFYPSKGSDHRTIKELGEVFTDASGIRAVIFHYTHSDGTVICSIKRLVTSDVDYRLPPVSS
jgi:hypothetical protein